MLCTDEKRGALKRPATKYDRQQTALSAVIWRGHTHMRTHRGTREANHLRSECKLERLPAHATLVIKKSPLLSDSLAQALVSPCPRPNFSCETFRQEVR